MLQTTEMARSLFFFLLAGLCEIGGGYLMWLCIREGRGLAFALLGAAILVLYGIIPTFQLASFGRVYAACGGIFAFCSLHLSKTSTPFASAFF
ncbi:MAG: YnfA family protein [Methanothrix sp.]|jgi:small multidrug resistance family-3 protein|nr:YnfA family protein [Methanothrix sp.]